jgi:hypothetical protein
VKRERGRPGKVGEDWRTRIVGALEPVFGCFVVTEGGLVFEGWEEKRSEQRD